MEARIAALEAKFEAHKEYTERAFGEIGTKLDTLAASNTAILAKFEFGKGTIWAVSKFFGILAVLGTIGAWAYDHFFVK